LTTLTRAIKYFKNRYACEPALNWLYKMLAQKRGFKYCVENCPDPSWLTWAATQINYNKFQAKTAKHLKEFEANYADVRRDYYSSSSITGAAYDATRSTIAATYHRKCAPAAKKILLAWAGPSKNYGF